MNFFPGCSIDRIRSSVRLSAPSLSGVTGVPKKILKKRHQRETLKYNFHHIYFQYGQPANQTTFLNERSIFMVPNNSTDSALTLDVSEWYCNSIVPITYFA